MFAWGDFSNTAAEPQTVRSEDFIQYINLNVHEVGPHIQISAPN